MIRTSFFSCRSLPLRVKGALGFGLGLVLTGCSGGDVATGPDLDTGPGVEEGRPAALSIVGGQGQQAPAWVPVRDSLVVRVTDGLGRPVPDVGVSWRIAGGSGEVLTPSARTDTEGRARALVIPGQGAVEVEAFLPSLPAVTFLVTGEFPATQTVYVGRRGYAEYRPGSLPIILAAPHGGTLEPSEIPVRSGGVQTRDMNTTDLAERMAAALESRLGGRPHLVLFHLHRRMVDANREIAEAAEGHPLGEQAWHEFQGMVAHAHARVSEAYGWGLFFDLHGHGHAIQRLELGYLLSAANLRMDDEALSTLGAVTSLRSLALRSEVPLAELVRGPQAFGSLLADAGFPSVPAAQDPAPGLGEPFFSGGYNTLQWGSRTRGAIDGIQIEANFTGVRDTAANREQFAQASAHAIATFLETWYGWSP